MDHAWRTTLAFVIVVTTGLCLASLSTSGRVAAAPTADSAGTANHDVAPADSIPPAHLITVERLAAALADTTRARPILLHVGFKVLYRGGHIPGSRFAGPGSKREGLAALAESLKRVPKTAPLVLYCGCCPWTECPNVHPAHSLARALGFSNVKVLHITKNLQTDWVDNGLPIVEGD